MKDFLGCHSEWNLGSPGGWDYQHTCQEIAKVTWQQLNRMAPTGIELDFDHPLLHPVVGFVEMLINVHRRREGDRPGVIAVTAEEETLEEVTENINLARRLDAAEGITGILAAPHAFEIKDGAVCHRGRPISLVFMDFNNDTFLNLHRKHDLSPLMQAVGENRVINPRGTEPFNVKSTFEVITGPEAHRFHPETVQRTPWTRRFYPRKTMGPEGETIADLVEWTRGNWSELVLKPERGYSGIGVKVGGVNPDPDDAIGQALEKGQYIVQKKVSLPLWAEEMPEMDVAGKRVVLNSRQTDFRCLIGPDGLFGFLGRYGNVPTNVGSGGGFQPLAILKTRMETRKAVEKIHDTILSLPYSQAMALEEEQKAMALAEKFTYLLGPIKIALRPRLITSDQLKALARYGKAVWSDCLILEAMWQAGEMDEYIDIEEEEMDIARRQIWRGGPAIFAADGLFSFGAHTGSP